MSRPPWSTATLLFDGECRVCRALATLVAWWDFRHRVRVLPFQEKEARRLLPGWTDAEVEAAAHLVLPEGAVRSGPHAFTALLDRLPVVGLLHRRFGGTETVRWLEHAAYHVGVELRGAARCATPRKTWPS